MAGMFIDVKVDAAVASDSDKVAKLVEVCPVSIFAQTADGKLEINDNNLDECVLCDLCLEVSPGSVQVNKLYENGE